MGAWGADSFDNDDAADWIADFCDSPDPRLIGSTLSAVADMNPGAYLEAPDCSIGLAAAEVVAALKGAPNANLPDTTTVCLANLDIKDDPGMLAIALKAINRIKTNSELKELWDESDDPDEWYQSIEALERRLKQ